MWSPDEKDKGKSGEATGEKDNGECASQIGPAGRVARTGLDCVAEHPSRGSVALRKSSLFSFRSVVSSGGHGLETARLLASSAFSGSGGTQVLRSGQTSAANAPAVSRRERPRFPLRPGPTRPRPAAEPRAESLAARLPLVQNRLDLPRLLLRKPRWNRRWAAMRRGTISG